MKLSPIFPGHIKPARVGVYQRDYSESNVPLWLYCYWDGSRWCTWGHTPEEAAQIEFSSSFQNEPWRGLAKP